MAVADKELRVRGVDGLRVADGSIIPAAPSVNTNATVYAVVERAAYPIRGIHLSPDLTDRPLDILVGGDGRP